MNLHENDRSVQFCQISYRQIFHSLHLAWNDRFLTIKEVGQTSFHIYMHSDRTQDNSKQYQAGQQFSFSCRGGL